MTSLGDDPTASLLQAPVQEQKVDLSQVVMDVVDELPTGPVHVCTDCGATTTPMWRRCPLTGDRLCNKCGTSLGSRQEGLI